MIRNPFDLEAESFDTDVRKGRAKAVAAEIRTHLPGERLQSAIEFGCGTGLVGLDLSDCFSTLVLVDNSARMIAEVEKKLAMLCKEGLSALCCNLLESIPAGLQADCIFSSLVLHHIADVPRAFSIFYGIGKENGRLLIVDLDTDDGSFHANYKGFNGHNGFDQGWIAALAQSAGFQSVTVKSFYSGCKNVNGEERPYSLFILDAKK